MAGFDYLKFLQRDIHSTVFATVDESGMPHTCVIDIMLADENGLYFLTARGKSFYERLVAHPFVAISGMTGKNTLSTVAVSVRGAVRSIGKQRLTEILEQNPYMLDIYPTKRSRQALEVFWLYQGEGEYFDLSQLPPTRKAFSFGGQTVHPIGYQIDARRCTGCQSCRAVCPTGCISITVPRVIDQVHCIHCGNCFHNCPAAAVERQK